MRDDFVEALAPPRGSASGIAWSSARPAGDRVLLYLGLRYPAGSVKTRWSLGRSDAAWRIEDVVLPDPGTSLASEAGRPFARGAIRPRNRVRDAAVAALPRALGIAGILAIAMFFGRKLAPAGRTILRLAAVIPLALFAIDGFIAVRRQLSEPYSLPEALSPPVWKTAEREALAAQREGRLEEARRAWERAVAAGAPAAPARYQLGLALKAAGRGAEAKDAFARALSESPSSPGASKELGLIALAEGRFAEARDRLRRYLDDAGPDPDAFSALAVAQANLGEEDEAVRSVEEARLLMADRWRGLRLQSQVYARAGAAAKTVETLRALESEGPLDRESLRSDPAYLPIATDPLWVDFLAETPAIRPTPDGRR
ncbi:MAG TPA: tetratricopeptide repeat protein [Thermoanaerobaculia bacterium]|nr:tetratricopeptide repeat protein [Thermoanaerobaculia bacterium]